MPIVDQDSYGKCVCSITILGCPLLIKIVTENVSAQSMPVVDQGSCGKLIIQFHDHHNSRLSSAKGD